MHLSDIMDVDALAALVASGHITRRTYGTYVLYNYTEKTTFERVWTPETRQSRGIITTLDGEIVARPFDKFFNVDETPETSLAALLERGGPVEITEKLDGSMVAVWYHDHSWHTSTRGSFESEQAIAAGKWLAACSFGWNSLLQDFTLLCEWCAPDNRIVLRYAEPECVLIGARYTATGADLHYDALQWIGTLTGLRVAPHTTDDLSTLAAARSTCIGVEGWVARWPDGFRVKIKTADYLRLHRLVSDFNARRVRDVLLAAPSAWAAYLSELPEEFRTEAESMAATMQRATAERLSALQVAFERLAPLATEGRKAYAMAVQREPSADRAHLFALLDKRPIEQKVLAELDLAALGFDLP